MAVKYRCTKCDRKFIEMGISKLKSGSSCEDCHGEYLQQIGYDASQAAPRKKPALKRKRVRVPTETEVAPTMASFDEDEGRMPDLDTLTAGSAGGNLSEEFESPEAEEVEVDAGGDDADDEGEGDAAAPADADADVTDVADVEVVKPGADDEEEEDEDDD